MLFLGITSWKCVSCFSGGGFVFQMGGGSFLSWGAPHGWGEGIGFRRGSFEKNPKIGGGGGSPPHPA